METFQKEFIGILKSAFSAESANISPMFDWEKAVDIAKKHNIVPIFYYGAINSGVSKDEGHMRELHRLMLQTLLVSTRQAYEIERIEKAFESKNIEYMPLKGTVLKALYPHPEMRTMGDADILIKLEQYPEIEAIMKRLQYTFQYESDHELVWKKPSLFLELHKSVMTTYNKDFYRYFGTGWEIAKPIHGSCRYEMTAEDMYLFIFVHFTKHYRISGIGIKHLIDLWVYSNARPDLDWAYIERELNRMRLGCFFNNVKKTIETWFGESEDSDVSDLITSVIFNSGQYGTAEMAIINRSIQNGKKYAWQIKMHRIIQDIFPPYEKMREKYPLLRKAPVILPLMWTVRCFDVLTNHKMRVKQYLKNTHQINSTQVKENVRALRVVGLEFEEE